MSRRSSLGLTNLYKVHTNLSEVLPSLSEVVPKASEVLTDTSEVLTDTSEVLSEPSEVLPDALEVRHKAMEVVHRPSEVTFIAQEVHPGVAKVSSETLGRTSDVFSRPAAGFPPLAERAERRLKDGPSVTYRRSAGLERPSQEFYPETT